MCLFSSRRRRKRLSFFLIFVSIESKRGQKARLDQKIRLSFTRLLPKHKIFGDKEQKGGVGCGVWAEVGHSHSQ